MNNVDYQGLTEELIEHVRKYGFKCRFSKVAQGFRIYHVDLSILKLRFSRQTPFIQIPRQIISTEVPEIIFQTIKDLILMLGFDSKIPFLLIESVNHDLKELFEDSFYQERIVILDQNNIKDVINSSVPGSTLLSLVRSQIPLSILSPYEVTSPVAGSQFFGREIEIRTIINHPDTNYLIVGSRRIGKTSLLQEVMARVQEVENEATVSVGDPLLQRICYFDCQMYNKGYEFLVDLMTAFNPKEYNRLERVEPTTYYPIFLRKLNKRLKNKVVIILDEIDSLFKFDRLNNYEITRLLMAGASSGYCRLIYAGFREAAEEMRRFESPVNAKLNVIPLGPFSLSDTRELVERPLESLGIQIENKDEIIRRIERDTGGHPNFIQHICQGLVRQLELSNSSEVTPAFIQRLSDDEVFRDRVIGVFVANTNDFEKSVAYAVAMLPSFTLEDVDRELDNLLIKFDLKALEDALSFLVFLGTIHQRGLTYRFTIPMLPKLIRERYSDVLIQRKAMQYYFQR